MATQHNQNCTKVNQNVKQKRKPWIVYCISSTICEIINMTCWIWKLTTLFLDFQCFCDFRTQLFVVSISVFCCQYNCLYFVCQGTCIQHLHWWIGSDFVGICAISFVCFVWPAYATLKVSFSFKFIFFWNSHVFAQIRS